ncbi:hypothetical protein [Selenomonas ruminantium]|uniref:hypothetical protein n=1 Tax=Selenomonas ruminantium TaxID=971 RepID=UPI0005A5399B|nr:hypothetical protein [Selenomonas ruminantium]
MKDTMHINSTATIEHIGVSVRMNGEVPFDTVNEVRVLLRSLRSANNACLVKHYTEKVHDVLSTALKRHAKMQYRISA